MLYKKIQSKGLVYFINENGDVYSTKAKKFLKPALTGLCKKKYWVFCLNLEGDHKNYYVHRLVYEAFIGPIEHNMTIDHIDFNKNNNSVNNLQQMSAMDNLKKSRDAGYCTPPPVGIGVKNGRAKLTENQVLLIADSKEEKKVLAERFKVTYQLIHQIKARKIWKHLLR